MSPRRPPDDDPDALSEEERRLFEEEMRGVKPIDRSRARIVHKQKPAPVPTRHAVPRAPARLDLEIAGEHVSAFDPSVGPALRRSLRQARPAPEGTLDLHGVRASAARARVEAFVYQSQASGWRRVLIVTGRGLRSGPAGPVLRGEVLELLTTEPLAAAVLGLVSAPPALGGAGALLVLLRATPAAD